MNKKPAVLLFTIVFTACVPTKVTEEEPDEQAETLLALQVAEAKITALEDALNAQEKYPEFPWPPPIASAKVGIPSELLGASAQEIGYLSEVDRRLSRSLDTCGYSEKSYYAVPDGFAMVTRLEQINSDGTPKNPPERWSTAVGGLRRFSLWEYLRDLFTSNPGYFRIIAFIVTPYPFSQAEQTVSRQDAMDWFWGGLNVLPSSIGEREYSQNYRCTALIYEFEKIEGFEQATIRVPGRLTGITHLKKSNIWTSLEQLR